MPTVGRYQREVAPAPLPGVRRTAAETPLSVGVGVDQAQREVATRLEAMGATAAKLGTEQYAEAVATQAQRESDTRLLTRDRQMADFEVKALQDPQTGAFATVKGEQATTLLPQITQQFDEFAADLEHGLSAQEKAAFYRLRDRRREGIRESVARYATEQVATSDRQERASALELSRQNAIANADNARRVEEEIDRTRVLVAAMPGVDSETRAVTSAQAVTAIHQGVIDSYLSRGLDQAAGVYFDQHQQEILGGARTEIASKLDAASTASKASTAADEIWAAHAPTSDADPINLDVMADAARRVFQDDPKTADAAIRYLRERKADVDAARKERQESVAGTLWGAVNKGASLEEVRRLPQFAAAPGDLQLQVSRYIVDQHEHAADRAYTLGQRARTLQEQQQETKGWSRYFELSEPSRLAALSENQILAELPTLGSAHVNRLIEKKRALGTQDAVRAAAVDDDQFKTLAQAAGLRPYDPKLSEADKARLGQLRNTIETEIDRQQQALKHPLTREQKQTVMQGILDRRVMLDVWGTDPSIPAAVVNGKDAERAYVPIEQIPKASLNEWVNVVRSTFPREQQATREDILRRYRDRIQRAHAAAVLGLGSAEERRRLLGQ